MTRRWECIPGVSYPDDPRPAAASPVPAAARCDERPGFGLTPAQAALIRRLDEAGEKLAYIAGQIGRNVIVVSRYLSSIGRARRARRYWKRPVAGHGEEAA